LTGMHLIDQGAWTDLSRRMKIGRWWTLASAWAAAAYPPGGGARYRRRWLAGQLAGDGQRGLPATKCDEESTEMKRRTRGAHLGARKGGRGAGGADRQ
jgi:hypothetical protein